MKAGPIPALFLRRNTYEMFFLGKRRFDVYKKSRRDEGPRPELRLERSRSSTRKGMAWRPGQSQHFFCAENTYEMFFLGKRRFDVYKKSRRDEGPRRELRLERSRRSTRKGNLYLNLMVILMISDIINY